MRKTTIAAALIAALALSGCAKTQYTSIKPEAIKDVSQSSTITATTQNTQSTVQASDKITSNTSTQPAKSVPSTSNTQNNTKASSTKTQTNKPLPAANSTQNKTSSTTKVASQQTNAPVQGKVAYSQPQPVNTGSHVPQGITTNKVAFTEIPDISVLPEEYQQKMNNFRTQRGYFYSQDGEGFVMTILSGQRNTGGYGIKVLSVEDIEGITKVIVEETSPTPETIVPQMVTYPAVTISLHLVHNRVEIVNTKGDKFDPVAGVQQ